MPFPHQPASLFAVTLTDQEQLALADQVMSGDADETYAVTNALVARLGNRVATELDGKLTVEDYPSLTAAQSRYERIVAQLLAELPADS